MNRSAHQSWCIDCQFDGKARFVLGTIIIDRAAAYHEREAEALALIDELFPVRPKIIGYRPGILVFLEAA